MLNNLDGTAAENGGGGIILRHNVVWIIVLCGIVVCSCRCR